MTRESIIPSGILRNPDRRTLPVFHYVVRNAKNKVRFILKPTLTGIKYDVVLLDLPGENWTKKSRQKNHIFLQSDGTYWVCTKEEFKPTTVKGGTERAIKFIERIQILLDAGISIDDQYKRKIPADSLRPVPQERTKLFSENANDIDLATERVIGWGKIILVILGAFFLLRACSGY